MADRGPIEESLLYLASQCDGAVKRDNVGFNGRDTEFGHDLADQIASGKPLSFKQLQSAFKMLRKYHRQLAEIGVDILDMPAPQEQKADHRLELEVRDGIKFAVIYTGWKDDDLIAEVKEFPGRWYDKEPAPHWFIPLRTLGAAQRVLEWAQGREDVVISEDFEQAVGAALNAAAMRLSAVA